MVGMFVLVGCGSAVLGDDDDPVGSNRPPNAPVFLEEKSNWEKESYQYKFYAEDPDGDEVFYEITWNYNGNTNMVSCGPDEPEKYWVGPYDSGAEIEQCHIFQKYGKYELTVRAKDIHGSIGPSTTITVNYKKSFTEFPVFCKLMEKFPGLFNLLEKLF